MGCDLASPVQYVKGVGPQRARLLMRLGINTVKDALFYLPYRYEDRSTLIKIAELAPHRLDTGLNTISGKVVGSEIVTPNPRRPRLRLFELVIADSSGVLKAKWFNQGYLKKLFKHGQEVVLYGVVKRNYWGSGFEMINPEYEIIDDGEDDPAHAPAEQIHTGRIVPVYRLTEGISQKQLRNIMYAIVGSAVPSVHDALPPEIITRRRLPGLRESLTNVHFPEARVSIDMLNSGTSPYHQRLSFDELFTFQAGLAIIKKSELLEKGIAFVPDGRLAACLRGALPFTLTGAQERVLGDILNDMKAPAPMNRLIQGDVGSGKTIVALLAMLAAVESGYQAALMAPTEILAEQHYLNIHTLVENLGLKIHLLTGSKKNKNIETISSGDADIVVGTHALIQEGVSFKNLGFIVIDEQHRFGVMQRATLRKKGTDPDTLIMTATPIPRTLAFTLYGDLDYSIIDELPPNRSPVITRQLSEKQKEYIYQLIEEQVRKGRQAYIVYPVIEESDKTNLKAAMTGLEALRVKFPGFKIGLLHGRMKPAEREEVMQAFKNGALQILVSTTVIEVGVDVPNATLIVIIHAERFGLAQLHQLRGRVGRGSVQSHCILLSYGAAEDARRRLGVMVGTNDGFKIAEEDLVIRGPGEFFGTRQSGLPDLKVADIVRDARLLEAARTDAFGLIEKDPELLQYPQLRRSIEDFWGRKLELFKTA
ncbi:MAG TPA: ATP-dependent DNA helicase RecG [Dissulfurispiraceae bacterium]|nr:ATP-dependent DNA helicase RecG [Dissulfurispiraceae bacterium]